LELEKSSSSAVTGKPLPASVQPVTSTSLRGRQNESLAAVVEKAKEKVQEMVKKRNQEVADVDSIPLLPAHKKSRVVPKSSTGVLSEDDISRQLQDDSRGTDVNSKKKSDSSATSFSDSSHHVTTNSEAIESTAESQKNDGPLTETSKTKKSLPFIGKLPFLKASRTAKQAAVEQSVTDDKSKIEIKLSVSAAATQEQAVPMWLAGVQTNNMENGMGEQNSLDAFLSIGYPESGQCQAVPVLNVGPQTRSEFMLENQPDAKKTSAEKLASSDLLPIDKDAKRAGSAVGMSGTDVVLKASVDVKAADTVAATPDLQHSGSVPLSDVSGVNQTDNRLLGITNTSVVQTKDTQILSLSEPHTADAAGTVVEAGTDASHSIKDNENSEEMSLDIDDNTEDYEPENDKESKQVTRVARDEETAQILPQISDAWMQPAASGYSVLSTYFMYLFNCHIGNSRVSECFHIFFITGSIEIAQMVFLHHMATYLMRICKFKTSKFQFWGLL